jgi:hypothetical protein
VSKGDKYQQDGDYEKAGKCYELVTNVLRSILK